MQCMVDECVAVCAWGVAACILPSREHNFTFQATLMRCANQTGHAGIQRFQAPTYHVGAPPSHPALPSVLSMPAPYKVVATAPTATVLPPPLAWRIIALLGSPGQLHGTARPRPRVPPTRSTYARTSTDFASAASHNLDPGLPRRRSSTPYQRAPRPRTALHGNLQPHTEYDFTWINAVQPEDTCTFRLAAIRDPQMENAP
eukprot:2901994-Pleurochrysis_carterae.AAC.1